MQSLDCQSTLNAIAQRDRTSPFDTIKFPTDIIKFLSLFPEENLPRAVQNDSFILSKTILAWASFRLLEQNVFPAVYNIASISAPLEHWIEKKKVESAFNVSGALYS